MAKQYKVLADYPLSPYKMGDVITIEDTDETFHLVTTFYRNEFGEKVPQKEFYPVEDIEKYQHLFSLINSGNIKDVRFVKIGKKISGIDNLYNYIDKIVENANVRCDLNLLITEMLTVNRLKKSFSEQKTLLFTFDPILIRTMNVFVDSVWIGNIDWNIK